MENDKIYAIRMMDGARSRREEQPWAQFRSLSGEKQPDLLNYAGNPLHIGNRIIEPINYVKSEEGRYEGFADSIAQSLMRQWDLRKSDGDGEDVPAEEEAPDAVPLPADPPASPAPQGEQVRPIDIHTTSGQVRQDPTGEGSSFRTPMTQEKRGKLEAVREKYKKPNDNLISDIESYVNRHRKLTPEQKLASEEATRLARRHAGQPGGLTAEEENRMVQETADMERFKEGFREQFKAANPNITDEQIDTTWNQYQEQVGDVRDAASGELFHFPQVKVPRDVYRNYLNTLFSDNPDTLQIREAVRYLMPFDLHHALVYAASYREVQMELARRLPIESIERIFENPRHWGWSRTSPAYMHIADRLQNEALPKQERE